MSGPSYDHLKQIGISGIDIAAYAPDKQHKHTYSAKVPWALIHELRDRLDAAGIDWRQCRPRRQ